MTIPPGLSAAQTASLLQEKGVIHRAFVFRAAAKLTHGDRRLKPGTYRLRRRMPVMEVLGVLTATAANTSKAIVRRTGYAPARLTGPIVYGDILVSAHTSDAFGGSGYAKAATMISGYGNTSFTGGLELGMALGAVAASTTGLVTCLLWR